MSTRAASKPEAWLADLLAAAACDGMLTDAEIRAQPGVQKVVAIDEVARSQLLVEVFELLGEIAASVPPQSWDPLSWLELHESAEFRWLTVIADELLRSEVSLGPPQWTRILCHIAGFGALLGFGHHTYLRPLEARLEQAAQRGMLESGASQPLEEIARVLERAGNHTATNLALFLRVLSRKVTGEKAPPPPVETQGTPERTSNPRASVQRSHNPMMRLLTRWVLDSMPRHNSTWGLAHLKGSQIAVEVETLETAQLDELLRLAMQLIDRLVRAGPTVSPGRAQQLLDVQGRAAWSLIDRIVRRHERLSREAMEDLLLWMSKVDWAPWVTKPVESTLLSVLERSNSSDVLSPGARAFLEMLIVRWGAEHKPNHKRIAKAKQLLGGGPTLEIEAGEAWSDAAIERLQELDASARAAWISLIAHCKQAGSASPTAKWARHAAELLSTLGERELTEQLVRWFPLVDRPRTRPHVPLHAYELDRTHLIIDGHMNILRGLCWICADIQHPDVARALGKLALSCYRKVPGVGPRAVKVGNAAVYALGRMPGPDALGQLAMLRVKVKFGTAQKMIEKAMAAAAEREGLPREEIEELGVPSYGLTDVGRRTEEMGEFTAELVVTGIGATELRFVRQTGKAVGKVQKSVPAAIKADYAGDLKELKAAAKDIGAMLPAQRDRIDSLFLENKRWPAAVWRERYLDHPLVGVIARRLIWRIGDEQRGQRSVMWLDGKDGAVSSLTDVNGTPVELDESATVRLWHPIETEPDEVLAWRRFVEDRQIRQPFKQAHREVYLLTDAERNTGTYSNRFAAHVLRQHQFNALCAARNWKNKLRLMVDDEYPPASRMLRAFNLRAEFWIEGAGDEYGHHTNEAGVYHFITTDQVRFYPLDAAQATAHAGGGGYGPAWGREALEHGLPLEQVPPLVFSEIMRDVDLFVGVASVGNNPQWQDGGPDGAYRNYWWEFGFGELSQSGGSRLELLQRLLPRLKIAEVCSLEDRFLRVRGKLRAYKIHLGSGNILMEPNDQYLCIVPSSRDMVGSSNVFLPFEGDRVLAIILSKAFMLAEDDKIKDSSIVSQIKGR